MTENLTLSIILIMKHLSLNDAKGLIEAVKQEEIALGRPENTWYFYENHVFGVAQVAKTISMKIPGMDPERIYVIALLHDIAKTKEADPNGIYPAVLRPEEKINRFHGILGYEMLKDKDEDAARANLLHTFPWNILPPFEKCSKLFFNNKQDYDFIANYIKNNPLKEEDLLIQLADSMANKNGVVTLEQRAKEFAEARKIEIPQEFFEPYMKLKHYFDKKINGDIYELF